MRSDILTPSLRNIRITDPLFGKYLDVVADKLLPYQWEVLNDRVPGTEKSYCIANFKIAAGELTGHHHGMVFGDTDAYKWLETVAYCLASGKAQALEQTADELIDLMGRAMTADGYLNTYYTIEKPDCRWTNLTEGHEFYSAGHMIEAVVAYFQATGKPKALELGCRFADLICDTFGEGKHPGYPGHQEIELALMKLYRVTGTRRYAEMARYLLKIRGQSPNYLLRELERTGNRRIFPEFADYEAKYAQSHLPPVEQSTAEGHAVRAVYMFSAMADVAREFGDADMENACGRLWNNIVNKRMYLTGGIGSSGHLERFTADYDLPNDRMYCESCASIGLMMFGQRMAALTGDAGYYDVVERALCNTVLGGVALEGDRYFYVNPLEVWPDNCLPSTSMAHVKPVRQTWFATACCPANISRTLASLGQYVFAQDEDAVYVNQFISSELDTRLGNNGLHLSMSADVMNSGKVTMSVDHTGTGAVALKVRIPEYYENARFLVDGAEIVPEIVKGYARIEFHPGRQELQMVGTVTPRWVAANRAVRADAGRMALEYGPFVYCLEQEDNGEELANLYVEPGTPVDTIPAREGLPQVVPSLRFHGQFLDSGVGQSLYGSPDFRFLDRELTAIPYSFWCNRNPGEMLVWLKAKL